MTIMALFKGSRVRRAALLALIVGAAVLSSAPNSKFSRRERAHYADPKVVNFVRPGLVIKILSATIAQDGTITTHFTMTDPQGLPLDRNGVNTPGSVSTSFIAATIPAGQSQYTAYTTTVQKSPITGVSATQAATDSGGTYTTNADGDYVYTFKTMAPASIDRTATHSVGVYGSRNLTSFGLSTYYSNFVFNFLPNGGTVTVIRDVVQTSSCNQCHDPLAEHGGSRQEVTLCVLCHTPQTTDPDTGNTVDLKVMVHKIHMGSSLPSVMAGGKYQIIGFNQSVNDYSTVVFPSDVRNCTICHTPTATQATNYLTKPTRASCGACHDDDNFTTGANHPGGPQPNDDLCAQCHIPQGEFEFDASVMGAHTIPTNSTQLPGTVIKLLSVANGSPGKSPTVTFTLNDKSGKPLVASQMGSLNLVLAGPSSDYAAYVSESAKGASGGSGGSYNYTFTATIPSNATGTYSIGAEGYQNININPGTVNQMSVRDAAINQVINFSVDKSPVTPRRQVVMTTNCNGCHTFLSAHGGNRNQVEQCVLCHNPNNTDADDRPASAAPNQGINFAMLIHKIHRGTDLTTDYTVYGFNGSVNNFNGVLFPGDLRNCDKCHVNESQTPPIGAKLAVTDPRGPINPVQPTTSACTGCHDDIATASHALSNTTQLGEACPVCHSADGAFSVDSVHAR
jgi:OmcA/MtrC family decaheme c-type cytochrome